jgi:diacylglycerol kinase (ATP)
MHISLHRPAPPPLVPAPPGWLYYMNMSLESVSPPQTGLPSQRTGFAGRVQSFRYALKGLRYMLISQKNAWIHAVFSAAVFGMALFLQLGRMEWAWIILAVVAVWTAEALNTAFEALADVASPEFHPLVERAKDVAAGAVLIAALGAALIGVLILGPPLWMRIFGA